MAFEAENANPDFLRQADNVRFFGHGQNGWGEQQGPTGKIAHTGMMPEPEGERMARTFWGDLLW
jgi:hypothetical protein